MGTSTLTVLTFAGLAVVASSARVDPCTGVTKTGGRFATFFDLGNRLSVTAGSNGFGLALGIRHEITFDEDPDLEWKMAHVIVNGEHHLLDGGFDATLYRGRATRVMATS